VRRVAVAGLFALALAAAGLLAAAVASGAQPLSVLTTTGTTTAVTTAPGSLIAAGVTIGGVPVGGMAAADAYDAVDQSFLEPLVIIVRGHRLAPEPTQLGASARIGEAVARAGGALPGTQIPLFLRNLRPWIAKPVIGYQLYRTRAEAAIVGALLANKRGPLRLRQRVVPPATTRTSFGPVIVIRRGSNQLHLYRGMQPWRIFPVATGQASYPTPLGRFQVVVKWKNPWWYPPSSPWAQGLKPVPPGPGNPLGTRWMGLSAPGVGIHGTPDAASIGYSASHGCIRMRIPEAEWLFRHVRVGTTVFIVSA